MTWGGEAGSLVKPGLAYPSHASLSVTHTVRKQIFFQDNNVTHSLELLKQIPFLQDSPLPKVVSHFTPAWLRIHEAAI